MLALLPTAVGNKRPASCKIAKNDNPKPFAIVTGPIATTMTFSMLCNSCYAAIPVVKFMLLLTLRLTVNSRNITDIDFGI